MSDAAVALGHLVEALQSATLEQTFAWDNGARDWMLQLLADAGLMREDAQVKGLYHLSLLAADSVALYRQHCGDSGNDRRCGSDGSGLI